jgi:hypothetical protein
MPSVARRAPRRRPCLAHPSIAVALTRARAHKLIRQIGGPPDDDLAAKWQRVVTPLSRPDETIVRLSDGRILSISYSSARIFASVDECLQLLAFVEQQTRCQRSHPLGAAYPGGQGFIAAVPELIAIPPGKLCLAAGTLDGSVNSLTPLDTATRHRGGPNCLDDPNVLAPIVCRRSRAQRDRRPMGHPTLEALREQQFPEHKFVGEALDARPHERTPIVISLWLASVVGFPTQG